MKPFKILMKNTFFLNSCVFIIQQQDYLFYFNTKCPKSIVLFTCNYCIKMNKAS